MFNNKKIKSLQEEVELLTTKSELLALGVSKLLELEIERQNQAPVFSTQKTDVKKTDVKKAVAVNKEIRVFPNEAPYGYNKDGSIRKKIGRPFGSKSRKKRKYTRSVVSNIESIPAPISIDEYLK
jgi:hypothetical protein